MARPADRRREIITAAARLFRRNGYANTGLSEILSASGAPKGSLYHHFPGGKEDIGVAVIEHWRAKIAERLARVAREETDPAAMVERVTRGFAEWLEGTDFTEGCAIATTVLETTPASSRIREAGARAFAEWRAPFCDLLRASGLSAEEAERMGALIMAMLEGGLIIARVEKDQRPLLIAGEEAARHVRTVLAEARAKAA